MIEFIYFLTYAVEGVVALGCVILLFVILFTEKPPDEAFREWYAKRKNSTGE